MITVVSFILVLGVLVFFHELGHYWVARRNGIVVEEFGMGYPPRLVKLFTYDGTDFTINLIPFGGFARMRGEDAGDMAPGSFNAASRGARAATLVAGPLMNAILAILLFAASFIAGFPAMVGYPQLVAVPADSAAAAIGLQENDILLEAGGQPVFVSAIPDFSYDAMQKAAPESGAPILTVVRDGETVEVLLPQGTDAAELVDETRHSPVLATEITLVVDGSPADQAGLQAGDLVYAINGTVVNYNNPLNKLVDQYLGQEVPLTVFRNGEWLDISVAPRQDPPEGEGAMGIQIGPLSTLATVGPLAALWQGVVSTGQYILLVLQLPVMLLMGQIAPSDAQLTGPVGIAQMVGGAVTATMDTGLWFPIWRLSAVLSAALAITNMLPLPALDGGRLLFIAFEAVRGRRVNPEREGLIHMVGFMLLLGLLVLITVRDITTAQQGIDWHTLLGQ